MKIVKKYIFIGILLVTLFMCRSLYAQSETKYKIMFDSIDNGVEYQIFYTTGSVLEFSEQNSVKYLSSGDGTNLNHNEIDLLINEPITSLRIDFGIQPGTIKIKDFIIEGKDVYKVSSEDIINGLNTNIDEYNATNDFLEIKSTQNDPFFVINNEILEPKNEYYINYFLLITFSIIICIVLSIIFYIIDKLKCEVGVIKATFVFIVLAIITTPMFFMNGGEIDTTENRTLAKFPELHKNSAINPDFASEFETWLNDRFGFRQIYISVDTFVDRVFQKERLETDEALLGKDGWMFYKANDSIANYQGINLYTDEELEELKHRLVERNNWLKSQGIEYYLFVPPDKHRIYGEFYPDYIKKVSYNSKLKQLEEALQDTDVKLITVEDELLNKKDKDLLYYKNDTHWNKLGAFYGYEALTDKVAKDFPEINPKKIDDFELVPQGSHVGDMDGSLQYKGEDVEYITLVPKYDCGYEIILNDMTGEGIKTINKINDLKVIMFRDSYTIALVPYISETFGSVEYLWYKQINAEQQRIVNEKPDIVIEESVERLIDGRLNYNYPLLQEVK